MPTILLVDDSRPNLRMLSRRLAREGFEMLQAHDGQEAIDVARARLPDIILMDLSLPVLDGWEAARRLKADPLTQQIPVLALTAHALAGERQKAIDAGCDDYDTKPIDLARLLSKIDALLNARVQTPPAAPGAEETPELEDPPPAPAPAAVPPSTAGRVLVVDDMAPNRVMLCRRLQREGFEAHPAASGVEAMELLSAEEFDVVLLDIMMPKVSGHEVLTAIRATLPPADLPVIMATARTQSEEIVRSLELGASDYVTKPFDFPVVLARVRTQVALRRAMRQVVRLEADFRQQNQLLRLAWAAMQSDLNAAARVQMALLPQAAPDVPGLSFAWLFKPSAELAGDILNIFRLDENHVGLFSLDVSGHGVAAALLAVTVSRFLSPLSDPSSLLWENEDPGRFRLSSPATVARRLQERFPFDEATLQYFTLLYGVLDLRSSELGYISAGHPPLIRVPPNGPPQSVEVFSSPIGVPAALAEERYEETKIILAPGERVYICSDGVPDAMSAGKKPFGLPRLLNRLQSVHGKPLQAGLQSLWKELHEWCQPGEPHDDISVLAIERSAGP